MKMLSRLKNKCRSTEIAITEIRNNAYQARNYISVKSQSSNVFKISENWQLFSFSYICDKWMLNTVTGRTVEEKKGTRGCIKQTRVRSICCKKVHLERDIFLCTLPVSLHTFLLQDSIKLGYPCFLGLFFSGFSKLHLYICIWSPTSSVLPELPQNSLTFRYNLLNKCCWLFYKMVEIKYEPLAVFYFVVEGVYSMYLGMAWDVGIPYCENWSSNRVQYGRNRALLQSSLCCLLGVVSALDHCQTQAKVLF